ncbi:hypothetical protein IMCC20628_01577 [Hoeflea sp. IMCC20628]|uniref:hypothetical protein n=1 Tax=Hoeflea sp. IMCC20628 TaxID=1620421 RepID=UPI00063BE4C5|nr:hypothetical protein [Hoeflea sp. IMCC20628]AKI00293.1 hypothetical protein IMCC20628_01577 [Hoeflea sp. IMCC20628]
MATGAAVTLKRLWRNNRWLTISFLLTLTLALFFIIRAGVFFVYWQNHADEPIEGWMTIRYVARSYRVDPKLVHDAVGLPDTGPDRRPLIRIARDEDLPLNTLATSIIDAIKADRTSRGVANSDLPNPGIPEADAPDATRQP